MKKRVLSMLLAFILCFSTLPMTAIAQEADAVTEQEADSAEEQEEAEAAAAPEAETSSDKSTTVETPGTEDSTAGEAPDKSVSDSDAGTQDTGADDEKKAAVQKVQALIDALPETVTVENAESVSAQLEAIDEAMAELTEEQREELDMTRLHAISEVLNTPMTVPMTVAEGQHVDHPICGATCTDENNHSIVTEWQPIGSETELKAATEGYYYLTQDIVTTGTWEPNNNVVLCLNGHSIAANGDFGVIEIKGANRQFTLCDCNSSASTHYFIKSVENNLTRWVPCEENTENRISVTGGVITHSVRTSDLGVKVDKNATFTMYGGTICGNKLQGSYNGAGVYVHDSTFNMYGGAIRGNAASWGGGVAALGSTFNMYGGVISDNMVSASAGGVLLSDKSVMNMSGNAQISNNIAPTKWTTSGGGVYIFASTDGEVSNCLYMSDNAKISGNTATSGGAVYVRKNGQVTMSGNAQISNNTATENGGGVYVENSTFKIAGGAPRVCDNLCQDVQNNVYLATGNAIRISKLSTFTGKIGVSTQDTPTGSNLVTVAAAAVESGAVGSLTEEYVDHISSDKENLYPVLVNGEVKLSATVPHRHPVCGETCGDSGKHSNQTWIGVSRLSDIKSSGNYYLTDNVTLDETWNCNISVNLCLNGKTITGAAGEETIRVAKGTTLTITDCQNEVGKITHAQDNIGRGIMSLGTLILYNGEITKNQIAKGSGAGVYVDGGNFYMYKGSISDNKVTINGNGGGVYAKDSTNFVISGGSIDSNHAPSSGGGIYYESTISKSVKFNISGGNIVRNTAVTGNGGGIWLKSAYGNMRFTMSGGRISNNVASKNGGGVYISEPYYGKFTVSSTAQITDNAGNRNDNNVYLPSGKTILIGSNGLDSSAKIGVTMGQVLDTDKYVAIAKGASNDYTLTANDLNAFNSDIGYKRYALDNAVNFSNGELHVHRLCGTANCTLTYHENVLWTAINTEAELRAIKGGTDMQYYYLTDNIKLNDTSWNPTGFISLCLNGHSITANGNFDAITVGSEDSSTAGDLHVCDCTGNGKITHAEDKTGRGVYVHPRSSFHLWGGSITGNSTNDCGGVYLNGGFGYLSGGSITNNSANEGGGVAIRTASFHNPDTQNSRISGYFYMYGGTITGNTATNGGGVAVKDKTSFRTFGGSVIGNTATANGGGVYVESSTANMSVDGTADHTGDVNITGNKDAKGNDSNVYLPGGTNISIGQNVLHNIRIGVTLEKLPAEGNFVKFVEAATGVTLTDKIAGGFTIDNNSSNTYSVQNIDNSLYVVNGALHKHAICGASCSHETKHDDVLWTPLTYNADTQKMMCGGTIVSSSNGTKGMEYVLPTGNYYLLDNITFTGTIKISGDVNLCLNGKCITNLAQNYASTIAVLARGNLTLCDHEDGTITSKDQKSYGVQFKAYNGIPKFTMYGGTITGTDAGVCQDASAGVFNMYGGAITGNRVGADIPAEITMTVGGTARIIDNTQKDVFLYEKDENSKSIIHIDPSLTNAASIGVATNNRPRPKAPVQIASGATGSVNYTEIFKPNTKNSSYLVTKDEQGNLYLSAHQHSWQYTLGADGKSITATCANTTNCPNTDGGSVTIKAPEENTLIYDGSNKTAILENKLLTGEKDPTISYTLGNGQGATLPDGSYPTNVGAYTASITVGGVTASVTYEIQKADPTAKNFVFTAPGSLTYDGTAKTANIETATNITGMGDVTVKYYQGETEVQPMNAGDYKVKISVADGMNFNAASDLTDENWAFTITPIITEPTVELSGNTTYTYTGERITPDVTVTIDGRPLTKGTDYTIIYGDNVNAGTNAGFVTVKAKGNYGFADVVKKFAIEKADPKLSFEKSTVTTSYGTQPANNKLTNMGNGVVTYQSNDNSVATVNEKGEVTVVGVGETTITATAAETKNYKLGTASYTLTVNKARVHIVQATVANKEYDGSVNADVTGVVFANEADVRIDSLVAGMDYTVTGAFQSENAGKQDAEVTVKLLGEFASHYELTGGTYKTRATITAKPISIATARTQDRSYERNNTSVTILEVTFKDSTNTLVATLTSSDYTATGKMVNANVGTDKKVTVTVTLQGKAADNYKLVSNMTTAKVAITQAKGGVLQEENLKQKFSERKQKTFTPDYTGLPAGETWTYSISEAQTSGSAKVEPAMINTAGKITYRLTAGAENDTICWTVTISNPNYEKFTKDLVLTLTAKEPQETLRITGDNTVAYGQKLLLSTVGGSGTGEITYRVDAGSTGDATIDENGVLTPVKVGSVVITATKAGDVDYSEITSAPFVIMITQAATSGEPKYHKITTGGKTLADAGLTLAGSTIHPADGTLEWIDDAGVLPNDTAVDMNKTYKWRFTPADTNYEILTGEIELYHVDAPAVTAQPKSVSVTVGDTATFEVTATGTDVTYQWKIDRNDGNGFVDITGATGAAYTTGVTDKDCDGFKYQCVIRNAAGSATTDTVVLTVLYQIIEGANGSWNQSTDGESLRIRGNGEYSKFQNVKVDGNIIDSKNYTVSEGSTIIELHADYLKTLSEGSHTFEIVWTDGAAGTGFTVARNTSGSNSTGSNNTGNNDNNDSTDNSAAAAPTAAATAQELDKVPATGEPHGIWLMLFAISLTGLAGMLARRKKN
ncbi:YDG domain-containing protein [Waltera sp.]|uniref:YDG domain-containing protein n=1 Tax=Waltera sp. TaxID=2815806 RepID=UPI003AB97F22